MSNSSSKTEVLLSLVGTPLFVGLPAPQLEGRIGDRRIELLLGDLRTAAQLVGEDLQALQPRVHLFIAGDDVPRRVIGVRALQHVVVRLEILLALGDVAEILESDLVLLVRLVQPIDHPALLLVRADMDEELDDMHAIVDELTLKLVDLAIGAFPFRLAAKTLDTLDEDAAIPGAVEDNPAAACRQALPETPQIMPALLVGRC